MASPILEFNYDISCPFAYIASTRIKALAHRANAKLIYRPVLLGALYRATNAPQGAGGSASDAFNPTKKAVTAESMQRTLKRYKIKYNPPPQHPKKTVNALRLLYCVEDQEERRILTEALFNAYWVEGRDVADDEVLLQIVKSSGIKSASKLTKSSLEDTAARSALETATSEALERGAFGVPGFWVPHAKWTDFNGSARTGRYFWGQDRMHFVEATLLSINQALSSSKISSQPWSTIPHLRSLLPRLISTNTVSAPTKVQLWYDFSSPWSYIAYKHIPRLQRTFPGLEVELKPFLLGVLFREIGVPMLPMSAVSKSKARWSRQDLVDWTAWWNALSAVEGREGEKFGFKWTEHFPLRSPLALKVVLIEPKTIEAVYKASWADNLNISQEPILARVLNSAGFDAAALFARAKEPSVSTELRRCTVEAQELGLCGAPTYRVLRKNAQGEWKLVGGVLWGQDQINVVEDLCAGWDGEETGEKADVGRVKFEGKGAKL